MHVHVYRLLFVDTLLGAQIHIDVPTYIHTCSYLRPATHITSATELRPVFYMFTFIFIYVYIHTYMYTYIYIYIYIYIYTVITIIVPNICTHMFIYNRCVYT